MGELSEEEFYKLAQQFKVQIRDFFDKTLDSFLVYNINPEDSPNLNFILQRIYHQGHKEGKIFSVEGSSLQCAGLQGGHWLYVDYGDTPPFYIFKYEAHVEDDKAQSLPAEMPTTELPKNEAELYCGAIVAKLPTLNQWQAVATQIANDPRNWGIPPDKQPERIGLAEVKSNPVLVLNIGHGRWPNGGNIGLENNHPQAEENADWFLGKRTHYLDKQVIWDVAGNAGEMISTEVPLVKTAFTKPLQDATEASWKKYGPGSRFPREIKDYPYEGGFGFIRSYLQSAPPYHGEDCCQRW